MDIVCCGAGTVGSQAAETLVAGGHDITIIDHRTERLQVLEEALDVRTLCGNCANADILREAGAEGADLVLASTNVDEVNLLTAAVAKALGARKTIARVHHSAYFEHRGLDYCRHLNIDDLFCPEHSTAVAIASKLRSPGALYVENFADDKIHMQQFPVGEGAVGFTLAELRLPAGIRLAAVTRGGTTFIPEAVTTLRPGDVVTVVGNAEVFPAGRKLLAAAKHIARSVAIMGGTSIAVWVCRALAGSDHAIRLFEPDRARATELAEKLDGVTVMASDPTNPTTFEEEHLGKVAVFAGLTADDEENILSCAWAKSRGAREVIAVVQKSNYIHLLEHLGIDHAVSPRLAAMREIEDALDASSVRRAAVLAEGSVDVYHVRVGPGCEILEMPLREMKRIPQGMIAAVQHGRQTFVPGPDDMIHAGDRLLVIGTHEIEKNLRRIFAAE